MAPASRPVGQYLSALPAERREALETVREVILEHLPEGYEESLGCGMLCYQVPLSVYPDTYNGQPLMYAAVGSQKNHMAVYLMSAYASPEVARELKLNFGRRGKKLDMGKSCVRFRKLEDLALDAVGEAVAAFSLEAFVKHARAVHARPSRSTKKRK